MLVELEQEKIRWGPLETRRRQCCGYGAGRDWPVQFHSHRVVLFLSSMFIPECIYIYIYIYKLNYISLSIYIFIEFLWLVQLKLLCSRFIQSLEYGHSRPGSPLSRLKDSVGSSMMNLKEAMSLRLTRNVGEGRDGSLWRKILKTTARGVGFFSNDYLPPQGTHPPCSLGCLRRDLHKTTSKSFSNFPSKQHSRTP